MSIKAGKYYLEKAIIRAPRQAPNDAFDVTNVVAEINLFESLDRPYISGNILLLDSSGLLSELRFNGQERLELQILPHPDRPITCKFVIHNILKQEKQKDSASLLLLSIIEEHAYLSYFKKLSWAFKGNISDIIGNIFKNELNLPLKNKDMAAQDIHYIAPNISPLAVCDVLTQRATSEIGEPFFLYSTLKEGVQLQHLGSLLSENSINSSEPYRFSLVQNSTSYKEEIRALRSLEFPKSDDTITLAQAGAFGAKLFVIDTLRKTINAPVEEVNFNSVNYFEKKKSAGRTLSPYDSYDTKFLLSDNQKSEPLHEKYSTFSSIVQPSQCFGTEKHLFEETEKSKHEFNLRANSDRAFLANRKYIFEAYGNSFLSEKTCTSIGKIISIEIPVDAPFTAENVETENIIDKKRSGSSAFNFLITACRHSFRLGREYICSVEVARQETSKDMNK